MDAKHTKVKRIFISTTIFYASKKTESVINYEFIEMWLINEWWMPSIEGNFLFKNVKAFANYFGRFI